LRVVELLFDTSKIYSQTEMEALKNKMVAHAGIAGHAYMQYIVREEVLKYIKFNVVKKQELLITKYKFEPKHRFYIRLLASCWIAGEIIIKLGLIEFDIERLIDLVANQLDIRPEVKEDLTPSIYNIDNKSVKALLQFLGGHARNKLVVQNSAKGLAQQVPILEPKDTLYIRYEMGQKVMYIHEIFFNKWLVTSKFHVRQILSELINLGIMAPTKWPKDLGEGTLHAVGGKTNCYKVWVSQLNKDDKEELNGGKIIRLERNQSTGKSVQSI